MNNEVTEEKVIEELRKEFNDLLEKAKNLNLVVDIDTVFHKPLAMGNYSKEVKIRLATRNKRYLNEQQLDKCITRYVTGAYSNSDYTFILSSYNDAGDYLIGYDSHKGLIKSISNGELGIINSEQYRYFHRRIKELTNNEEKELS